MEKLTFNVMEYQELDALVNENIPSANGKYDFVSCEEANNDSSYAYHGIAPMDVEDELVKTVELDEIMEGNLAYKIGAILEYLCYLKAIEPGNYLIEVCW